MKSGVSLNLSWRKSRYIIILGDEVCGGALMILYCRCCFALKCFSIHSRGKKIKVVARCQMRHSLPNSGNIPSSVCMCVRDCVCCLCSLIFTNVV